MSKRKTIKVVSKPWGREDIFAELPGHYAAKLLHVKRGHALSLQWHRRKNETLLVLHGRITLYTAMPVFAAYYGVPKTEHAQPHEEIVEPGEAFHLSAGTIHRIEAIEDSILVEVSDCELDDVVRLEDRYGRVGEEPPTCMGMPVVLMQGEKREDFELADFRVIETQHAHWLKSDHPVMKSAARAGVGTLVRSMSVSMQGPGGVDLDFSAPWPLSAQDRTRLDVLVGREMAERIVQEGQAQER